MACGKARKNILSFSGAAIGVLMASFGSRPFQKRRHVAAFLTLIFENRHGNPPVWGCLKYFPYSTPSKRGGGIQYHLCSMEPIRQETEKKL